MAGGTWDLYDPCNVKRCEKLCCPGMAKQGRIPDDMVWMFGCLPLRTCVFLNCLFTVIFSVSLTLAHRFFEGQFRTFTGGYALQSRVVIEVIEVVGILAGSLGLVGTVILDVNYISLYQTYQMIRLAAVFLMYITDVPLLMNCEMFRNDLPKAIEEYDWNPIMFELAINNKCSMERKLFVFSSTLYLAVFIYLTYGTREFLRELDCEPRYLMRVPKGRTTAAFTATSLASRSLETKAMNLEKRLEQEADLISSGLVGAPVRTAGALPERLPSFGGPPSSPWTPASMAGLGSVPGTTMGAPMTSFGGAPMGSFGGAPMGTYGGAPMGTYGAVPPMGSFGAPMGTVMGPGRSALDLRL